MLEGGARVVGRVDEGALHLAGEILLQSPKGQQVVAVDQDVVEKVALAPRGGVVREAFVFNQDAGFDARPVVFADPNTPSNSRNLLSSSWTMRSSAWFFRFMKLTTVTSIF